MLGGVRLLRNGRSFFQSVLTATGSRLSNNSMELSGFQCRCQLLRRQKSTRSITDMNYQNQNTDPTSSALAQLTFAEFDKALPRRLDVEHPRMPVKSNSFADFIDYSKTLQTLLLLGVQLHEIERKHTDALNFLVTLELEDVKSKVEFLVQNGLPHKSIGELLTKCPKILDPEKDVGQFEEIISYLKAKGFKNQDIAAIMLRLPSVLTMPVEILDGILGFYQKIPTGRGEKQIKFSNSELKSLTLRCPMLLKANLPAVYEHIRTLEMSCKFTLRQIRQLIFLNPWILLRDGKQLELLYKFYSREMGLSNKEMADFPWCFGTRIQRVLERHEYIKKCGKAQYNRDQPGYISLKYFYEVSDEDFCKILNLGTVEEFKKFIKTI